MAHVFARVRQAYAGFEWGAQQLSPLLALAARVYVAHAFFVSGLTKLRDWDVTLALFQYEYQVPWLSPQLAAVLGTAGEVILPVLLVLGWPTRFAALGLFIVNVVAVISYPALELVEIKDHYLWGALLGYLLCHGAGGISLEGWLARRKLTTADHDPSRPRLAG